MARPKVAFLTSPALKERKEFTMSLAPPDLEVVWIDNSLSDEEKIPLCKDADAVMMLLPDLSVDVLKHCPKVKLLQTLSAGYDRLDIKAINELGIPIANNGGANAIAVAEQTIALMISVCKQMMLQWHNTVKDRVWRGGLTGFGMVEVTDKTVGIVGLGRIGKQVAKRLKGFDTKTIYYDVVEMPLEVQEELNAEPVSFEELLSQSDIVTIHVPLNSVTRGMISNPELEMMKSTAYLISTCRGPVVDEKALYHALKRGSIAAAGLDVLEKEPTPTDNPLLEMDNVVITPHMAGYSYETNIRASNFAYANIKRALAGEEPESLVTPDI